VLDVVEASNHVQNLFLSILRVSLRVISGQVNRRESLRVTSITASLVIRHKFFMNHMTIGLLVFLILGIRHSDS